MVTAISMCRDEADIAPSVLVRMARHVDHIIVADNGSVDGTRDLLEDLSRHLPLEILDDPERGYYQARKMTALAARAIDQGANWIIPFDFDEVWLPRPGGRIFHVLNDLDPSVLICEAQLFDHVATGHDDSNQPDPIKRLVWRRPAAAPLRKVAVRAIPGVQIHQGNHSASFDGIAHPPTVTNALEVRHFPYRSPDQLVTKAANGAAAYAATDLPDEAGAHWRGYGRILADHGPAALHDLFHKWFYRSHPDQPLTIDGERQPPLVLDPCP